MNETKYILEYCYAEAEDWREEAVFDRTLDAHYAFTEHVKEYSHVLVRVRKVRYVTEEDTIAMFQPIGSEEYDDDE